LVRLPGGERDIRKKLRRGRGALLSTRSKLKASYGDAALERTELEVAKKRKKLRGDRF